MNYQDALAAAKEAKDQIDNPAPDAAPLIPNQDQAGGIAPLTDVEEAAKAAKVELEQSNGNYLRDRIRKNLESGDGFGLSPQESAQAFQLADDTGTSPQFIASRLKNLSLLKQVDKYDYQNLVRFFPATAKELERVGTPVFQDLKNLSGIEWLVKGGAKAWMKGVAGNELQMLNYKAHQSGLNDQEEARRKELGDFLSRGIGYDSTLGELFAKGIETTGQIADMGWDAVKFGAESAAAAGLAAAPAPELALPAMGVGFAAGTAYNFWQQATKLQVGSDYRAFLDAGMDEKTAKNASTISGAIGGAIEFLGDSIVGKVLGFGKLIKRPFKSFLTDQLKRASVRSALTEYAKDYGMIMGAETTEEVLQDLNTMLALNIASKFSNTEVDTLSENQIMDSLLVTLKETAKGLVLFSGLPGIPKLGVNLRRAGQARQNQAFFKALSGAMSDSEIAKSMPSSMRRFVADVAKDGPVKEIYINAREFKQTLAENNINPDVFETLVPGMAKRMAEAEKTDGDVTIPIDVWATKIAPSEIAPALNDIARLREEDMSPREMQKFASTGAIQELRNAIQEATRDQASILQSNAEEDVVYQKVRQQLVEAGQAAQVADKQAALYRAFFKVMAKRSGKSPVDLFSKVGLQVVNQEQVAAIGEALKGTDVGDAVPKQIIDRVRQYADTLGIDQSAIDAMDTPQLHGLIKDGIRLYRTLQSVAGSQQPQDTANVAPFDTSFPHEVVPLSSIQGADKAHAPERATPALEKASQGKGPLRRPPSVRRNADGTFTVLDGRSGTKAAENLGYTHIPVRVIDEDTGHTLSDPEEQAKLERIYDQAARDKDKFDKTVEQLAEEFNGYPLTAVLKGRKKAVNKIEHDYDGNAERIKDILRATLIVGSAKDVEKARARIEELFEIDGKVRDLFKDDVWPSGYQDMKFNVRMNGQVYELQVNTLETLIAKEAYGHTLYDESIRVDHAQKRGELSNEEAGKRIDALDRAESLLYDYAKEAHASGTPLDVYESELHARALEAAKLAREEADFSANFSNSSRETKAPFLNAAASAYQPGGFSSIRTAPLAAERDTNTGIPSTSSNTASSGNLSGNGAGSNFFIGNPSNASIPQVRELDQSAFVERVMSGQAPDSLSEEALAYRKKVERKPLGYKTQEPFRNKDGNYRKNDKGDITGAPLGVKNEADVQAIVDRVTGYLDSPLANFDVSHLWYEESGAAIREITQGEPLAMERLVRMTAVLSATNQVGGNTTGAIKAIYQLSRGEVPAAGRFPNEFRKRSQKILEADQMSLDVPGVSDKVLNFYSNLWDATFLSNRYENAATMDMWMARLFGYSERDVANADALGQSQYRFTNYLNRQVTERMNEARRRARKRLYKPRMIQAALWAYARNRETYGGDIGAMPVTSDRGTFETYIKRATQNVTVEAMPSVDSGLLPEILDASWADKEAYTQDAFGLLLNNEGNNELFARLGIPLGGIVPGSGSFEGAVSPNRIVRVVADKTAGLYDTKKADLAALSLQYIYSQDGVPWFQLNPSLKGAAQGFAVNFKGEPDLETQQGFYDHLREFLPSMDFTRMGSTLFVLNFEGISRKAFKDGIVAAVNTYTGPGADLLDTKHLENVKAKGNYHDIKDVSDAGWADPAASSKLEVAISKAGGRDLLPWLRDRRQAVERLQADWRDKLSEGRTFNQGANLATGSNAAGGTVGGGLGYGTAQEGAIQVQAVHYSRQAQQELDSSKYGTGKPGAERARLARDSADPRVKPRVFFYVDEGAGVRPESGVGSRAHPVTLNNLYDLGADPLNLKQLDIANKDDWFNAVEVAIVDAGYDGYYAPGAFGKQGVAVLLGEHKVPVQAEPRAPLYQSVQESGSHPQGKQGPGVEPAPGVPAQSQAEIRGNFRVRYEQVPVGMLHTGLDRVTTVEEAAHVLAPIRKHAQETMMALVLDDSGKILNVIRHTKGAKDASSVDVGTLTAAIGSTPNAAKVWFAHNHPSGVAEPSSADQSVTRALDKALNGSGVEVQGHVVLAPGGEAYGFTPFGEPVKINIKPAARSKQVDITERVLRKTKMKDAPTIDSPDRAREIAADFDASTGVMMLDNRHRVLGLLEMTDNEMSRLRDGKQIPRLLNALDASNASAAIVIAHGQSTAQNIGNYIARLQGVRHLDSLIKPVGVQESIGLKDIVSLASSGADLGSAANEFFQPGSTRDNRGSIQLPDRLGSEDVLITLAKSQDLSTFLHESGHLFLEVMRDLALDPNADASLRADWEQAKRFLGITDDNALIDRQQHETWAEAFEKYLFEGEAPSPELEGAFATFRSWLIQVYKGIKEAIGITGVELNDEIRGVFDRMLASEEEINAARARDNLVAMFKDAESAGMSERQFAAYQQALRDALSAAENDLIRKALATEKRRQRDAWASAEAELRPGVEEELHNLPVYQATLLMTGDDVPEGAERVQLSRQAVKALLEGEADADQILKGLSRHGVAKRSIMSKEGADPDVVALMFGFDSGVDMLREIANAQSYKKELKARLETAVRDKLGDLLSTNELASAAVDVVHGDPVGRFIATELKALSKRVGQPGTPANVARQIAREVIGDKRVIDLNQVNKYLQAERRASNEATKAAAQGNLEEAARHKRTQLINHYLYAEARKAQENAQKLQRYLDKFSNPGTRKNLARDYLDQIDSALEAWDLRKGTSRKDIERRQSLAAFVQQQQAEGNEVALDEDTLSNLSRRSYKEMTYTELMTLASGIKNIETLARLKQKLLASRDQRLFAETVDDMYDTAAHNSAYEWHEDGIDFGTGIWHDLKDWKGAIVAEHVKPEMLFRLLDGDKHGVWWHSMFQPIADADDAEQLMMEEVVPQLQNLFAAYDRTERLGWFTKKIRIDAIDQSMTKSQILSVALNWGNEDNRKQIMEGFGWDEDQVNAVLSKLTDKDWDFVQGAWDLIDQFWPAIAALEKELSGVVPEKVQPAEFETPDGRRMRGGYYPLHYDPRYNQQIAEGKEKDRDLFSNENNWLRAATRHGHTKERVDHKGMAVSLDLHVITRHIGAVIHDLAFRKAVMQVEKLRNDPMVRQAIVNTAGLHAYEQIRPWLQAVANDRMDLDSNLEKVLGYLRKGTTIANMGLKISTAMVQPLGYTQSIDLIGERWAAQGLAKFYANPRKSADFILANSVMMRNRTKTYDRDVRDALKRLTEDSMKSRVEATYFQLIGMMDLSVSMPTWMGAYDKAIAEGASETEAVSRADSAVRLSQGAGSAKDLAAIQRGGEFKRMLTMFYSYFNTLFNMLYRRGKLTRTPGDVPRAVLSYFYLVAIPAVLAELMMGQGPEDDEKWWWWATKKVGAYPAMSMVGVRDVANALTTPFDYQITPIAAMIDTLTKGTKAAASGNFSEYAVKNLAVGSGVILHLPSRQLYTTLDHLFDVAEGRKDLNMYELLVRKEYKK